MNNQDTIFKLYPCVQHYNWGGTRFIPAFLKTNNEEQKPFAELWMGTHHSCPAEVESNQKRLKLSELIQANVPFYLGSGIAKEFNDLPYLFKILDVNEMLSIQVHPNKAQALKGFEAEQQAGIPLNAFNRNYKDANHKPELLLALSDFYLLYGFKSNIEIARILKQYPSFSSLIHIFNDQGMEGLYRHVMTMDQSNVDEILLPVLNLEFEKKQKGILSKDEPGYWVLKSSKINQNFDRGIFSIYFLNLLKLINGDCLFIPPNLLHAYLEGQCIELMAASDNVLRGGLTSKHIDVPELLKTVDFNHYTPYFLHQQLINGSGLMYEPPVTEFRISRHNLLSGTFKDFESYSFDTLIVLEGIVDINGKTYTRGEVIAVAANTSYKIKALNESVIIRAFVPE